MMCTSAGLESNSLSDKLMKLFCCHSRANLGWSDVQWLGDEQANSRTAHQPVNPASMSL